MSCDCRHHKAILGALREKNSAKAVKMLKQDLGDFTLLK